jgi:predicted ATPase/Tfp pilus assembly protein PilF
MAKTRLTQEEMERVLRTVGDFAQEGLAPHLLIDDLMGLETYRRLMQCPDLERLAAFAEDALPLDAALQVAQHLAECPLCRADVEPMRSAVRRGVPQLLAAMPVWTTPFIEREDTGDTPGDLLERDDTRPLALAAAAGVGKTRLLLETALEQSYLFPDGVWYVPMADSAPELAVMEIARAAGLPLQPRTPPREQLRDFLAEKRALLVLDDMDAGTPVPHEIEQLLSVAPNVRCVASGIGVTEWTAGRTLALTPLRTPDERGALRPETWESVRAFTGHIRAFRPGYAPDEPEARAVAAICRRAAGVPLGLELTAARVREMPPQEILRRLEAAVPPTQAPDVSLNNMMTWSFDLLSGREQQLLCQLGVFAESFTVGQAVGVSENDNAPDLLAQLLERALLQRLETSGPLRYRLLMPVRRFARRRLGEEARDTQARHAAYFLRYARERADLLEAIDQVEAMRELSADLPNLRAGMDWAQNSGAARLAGGYGLALQQYLRLQGLWQENTERLRVAVLSFARAGDRTGETQAQIELARNLTRQGDYEEATELLTEVARETETASTTQAETVRGFGNIAQFQGDYAAATAHFTEALRLCEARGDRRGAADCTNNLGWIAWMQSDYPRAETLLQESLRVYREWGDRYRLGSALAVLGNVAHEQGRLEEARGYFEQSLQARQELGDVRGIASSMTNIGMVWQALGDYTKAAYCYDRAVRHLERIGARRTLGQVRCTQGELALLQNNLPAARAYYESSRDLLESVGEAHGLAETMSGLGQVAEREGDTETALGLYCDSMRRFHALGDAASVAMALYRVGALRASRGEFETPALLLHRALALCAESHRPEDETIRAALTDLESKLDTAQAATLRERAAALSLEETLALA